jgi:hypothetical protein
MLKLTVRVHTPSMLLALLSFGIMQPPSPRTVRVWCSGGSKGRSEAGSTGTTCLLKRESTQYGD